jgi:site-specific DNA-methyltransferase (adenine-specific)
MIASDTERGRVFNARAEDVYPLLDAGAYSLIISDGPYGMSKAEWDRSTGPALREWYRPHVEAWGRLAAASASVYLWGTSESWATLHPLMLEHGWRFRVLVTWEKTNPLSMKGTEDATCWPDVTEVCGLYQRNAWEIDTCAGQQIAYAAGADDRNWIRLWLRSEWMDRAGLLSRQMDEALGTNGMAGHYLGRSQWSLPTWDAYQQIASYAATHGRPLAPGARPYLVHPDAADLGATYEHLRATYEHLRAEYEHLRAEYEAARVPFDLPAGVSNVWRAPIVGGSERLKGPNGDTLHPCQKPLRLYRRIIRASSRVGDQVLEPFGGTCRAAVACERLSASEARRYTCIEPDRRYVEAVTPSLRFEPAPVAVSRQGSLFL